jgi:hypothetical protein
MFEYKAKQAGGKQSSAFSLLHADFLLGLFLNPEEGGGIFLRNVGLLSTDYMALHPRRYKSS